ncbi:unnamed protein product [Arctia plantaginis]|uniref:Death domain-containing protein n=1 Tax=Arctia plantaginis TaxID=874455 RepID=A0A8S0YPY6_ARCPL|nr:unnamed protein product [Arctia plantaginis]CAB3243478.1 unnamed protein product [Arctia plantaginis]
MTLSDYTQLKQCIVLAVVQAEKHNEILSSIKELFSAGINSVRRVEQIKTIRQLLSVLELRDILSEDNVQSLKNIALKLPNTEELLKKISDYEKSHVPREYGNYYVAAQNIATEPEESYIMNSHAPCIKTVSKRKKQRIFQTIIEEIGSFWRDLGRNLKVRECRIDEIDSQSRTLTEKATKVMKAFEYEKADPDKWFFILCDALEKSRRKDLTIAIQEVMAMNI